MASMRACEGFPENTVIGEGVFTTGFVVSGGEPGVNCQSL